MKPGIKPAVTDTLPNPSQRDRLFCFVLILWLIWTGIHAALASQGMFGGALVVAAVIYWFWAEHLRAKDLERWVMATVTEFEILRGITDIQNFVILQYNAKVKDTQKMREVLDIIKGETWQTSTPSEKLNMLTNLDGGASTTIGESGKPQEESNSDIPNTRDGGKAGEGGIGLGRVDG